MSEPSEIILLEAKTKKTIATPKKTTKVLAENMDLLWMGQDPEELKEDYTENDIELLKKLR